MATCWTETANAGGAVGLPRPPVTVDEVREAVGDLVAEVDTGRTVLVVARDSDGLTGWVWLDHNDVPLVAHWATVRRLQSPTGTGSRHRGLLMHELTRVAHADGLEQLHLAVRGGMGLENFHRGNAVRSRSACWSGVR